MKDLTRHAATGTVVGWFASEEAVYLKVAVEDGVGKHLGWAKGVRVDKETLASMIRTIDRRLNEALQMALPWDEDGDPDSEGVVRWMPPKP